MVLYTQSKALSDVLEWKGYCICVMMSVDTMDA